MPASDAAASSEAGALARRRWTGEGFAFEGALDERKACEDESEACRAEGNRCYGAGEYAEANAWYGRAIAANPEDARPWGNRSALYLEMGHGEESLHDAEQMRRIQPDNGKAHLRVASALYALNRFADAHEAFRNARRLDPGNDVAARGLEECAARLPAVPIVNATDRYDRNEPTLPASFGDSGNRPKKPLTLPQVLQLAADADFWVDDEARNLTSQPLRKRVDLARFFDHYGVTSLSTFNARYGSERLVAGGAPARWLDGRAVPGTGGTLAVAATRTLTSTVRRDGFL